MSFRIDRALRDGVVVVRIEGALVGPEAAGLLGAELAALAGHAGGVALDAADASAYDEGCLAILADALAAGVAVVGGAGYLHALLRARPRP
jgi:hypothetical protein